MAAKRPGPPPLVAISGELGARAHNHYAVHESVARAGCDMRTANLGSGPPVASARAPGSWGVTFTLNYPALALRPLPPCVYKHA